MWSLGCLVVVVAVFDVSWGKAPPLKSYDVDASSVSVSGISAGAAFATQMHVAFSSSIMGMGSIAGIPYYCAGGVLTEALSVCMAAPGLINVNVLISDTANYESSGRIDPTSNLKDSKVFILHGTGDATVLPGASDKMNQYYQNYESIIATEFTLDLGHGFPTVDYGVNCPSSGSPYINRCEYNGAYHMLNHFYGNLVEPTKDLRLNGQLLEYDQDEFNDIWSHSFDMDGGYVYIPSGCSEVTVEQRTHSVKNGSECDVAPGNRKECGWSGITEEECTTENSCCWREELPFFCYQPEEPVEECAVDPADRDECGFSGITPGQCVDQGCCWREERPYFCYHPKGSGGGTCKLHVAFHGCIMGRSFLGDEFARHAGYLEVGEANNIIMLFPQIYPNIILGNLNGCFDWWGYDDADYATKAGLQSTPVKRMIDRILGLNTR